MTISDADYREILVEVGYPVVKEDELEFSREEIQDFFIFPAMRDYFSWFPIIQTESIYVSSEFSVDFPDEKTYGIIDARINTAITGDGRTSSPLINSLYFKKSGMASKKYGTEYDYGVTEAKYMERAYNKAVNNYIRAKRLDVDQTSRTLSGFTTVNGELVIQWAKYSDNFNDIPFKRKSEVLNLAKSKLLKSLAMLRSQFDSDTGTGFNTSDFMSRADDLEEKVMTKWKAISKVAIIRN